MPESFLAAQYTPTRADRHAALFTHHNRPPLLLTIEVQVPSGTTDTGNVFPGSYVVPLIIEAGRLSSPGAGAPYGRTIVTLGRPKRAIKVPTTDNASFNEEMLCHPDSTVVRGEDGNYYVCPPGYTYAKGVGLVEVKEEVKEEEVKSADVKVAEVKSPTPISKKA